MRKGKIGNVCRVCAVLVLATFAFFGMTTSNTAPVYAGSSKVAVLTPNVSVSGSSINEGDFIKEGGVYAKDGKAIFDDNCSVTAKLLAKTKINNLKKYGLTSLMEMSITLNVSSIADGGKISFAFGLNSARNVVGSADSAEIAITYESNKLNIAVNEYVNEDNPKAVSAKSAYSMFSLNSDITFNMNIDVNNKVYLSAECKEAQSGKIDILRGRPLTIDAAGYVSITSFSTESAKNNFKLFDMSVTGYAYDVVETVDHYLETFDNGTYNANMFYSESTGSPLSPSKIYVENGRLVFRNVGKGYFTTREQYSNFELKFDIVDLYREGLLNDDGSIKQLISHWFMIGFGVDEYNAPASERIPATFLQLEGMPLHSDSAPSDHITGEATNKDRYVLWNNGAAADVASMRKLDGSWSIWDNDYVGDATVNVKFTVIDGVISLYAKLDTATEYTLLYNYDLGTMQTGYVRLYTYGQESGEITRTSSLLNMTIDNFEITNLDNDAVKLTKPAPEYKSNVLQMGEDFVYTTTPDSGDLLNNKLAK